LAVPRPYRSSGPRDALSLIRNAIAEIAGVQLWNTRLSAAPDDVRWRWI